MRDAAKRSPLVLSAVIALCLAILAGGGWYGFHLWQSAKISTQEARRVGELHEKVAVKAQPLTDVEFEEVLALTSTTNPEARFVALLTATAHAKRHRPDLTDRVRPIANRLANDPDATVRQKATQCQTALASKSTP